jgi:hypothetical protein
MVPSEQAVIDPELQSTYDEIQALITPTLDRRSGGATDDDRYEIWTELVWPKLAELLEQDKQDRANQLEQSLNNMEVTHSKSCCGQDGSHVHQQASSVQDGETTGFAQAFQKAKGEIESIAKKSGADNEKIRQELTGHSFEARQEYVRTLQKYAATLDELEEAYRQFLTKEKVLVKKHRVARDGEEIHPDMLVSGYLASLAGEDRPAMWDSIVRKERYITAPGPFDMWVVSDATSSMKNNSLNILASESTALLGQSFERYNHLTIQLLEDPEELDCSRLSVITFAGTATIEQPLVPFATDRQRLDAFHHVKEAAGNNTIISSGLDAVKDMHEETDPPRRKLVIVVSDGDDNQVSETKKSIQKLLNLGFSVRFLNFSGTRKGYQGEELVASPTELPGIMLGIARSIIDGEKES